MMPGQSLATRVYLENLPANVDEAQLQQMLSNQGQWQVKEVVIFRDTNHKPIKAYVEMATEAEAEAVVAKFKNLVDNQN